MSVSLFLVVKYLPSQFMASKTPKATVILDFGNYNIVSLELQMSSLLHEVLELHLKSLNST